MIVVDTSAVMAMVLEEPDNMGFRRAVARDPDPLISAASLVELDVVTLRRGGGAMRTMMERIIGAAELLVMPVEGQSLRFARRGFETFGQGRGDEPAALNFGDCFSYGLAMAKEAPLLFKGEDFSKTDVKVAEIPGEAA
ncbi:MAG: type II toxin-antitoxin system VapC family toxin [Pseudomonadota bacterium]